MEPVGWIIIYSSAKLFRQSQKYNHWLADLALIDALRRRNRGFRQDILSLANEFRCRTTIDVVRSINRNFWPGLIMSTSIFIIRKELQR